MRWIIALLALPLAAALVLTSAPVGATAAAAPGPSPLPYIGPDGVGWVEQNGKQTTQPVKDIRTGLPAMKPMSPMTAGWTMLGVGATPGGALSQAELDAMCVGDSWFDYKAPWCGPWFSGKGFEGGRKVVRAGDIGAIAGPGGTPVEVPGFHPDYVWSWGTPPGGGLCVASGNRVYANFIDCGSMSYEFTIEPDPSTYSELHESSQSVTLTAGMRTAGTWNSANAVAIHYWCYSGGDKSTPGSFTNERRAGQLAVAAPWQPYGWLSGSSGPRIGVDVETVTREVSCLPGEYVARVAMTHTSPGGTTTSSPTLWQPWLTATPAFGWHMAGLPASPVATVEGEASGTITVSVDCTDGDGGTQVITASSVVTVAAGEPFDLPETVCPVGWVAYGAGADWTPDGGAPQEILPRSEVDQPTRDMIELRPDCFNGNSQCVLELKQLVGEQLLSCGSIGQLCPDWASDPNAPNTYQCYYGGGLVDLNQCSAYRAPDVGILPNIDIHGNPIPYTAPVPVPSVGGVLHPVNPTASDPRAECASKKPPSFWEGFSPHWIYQGAVCAMVDVFVPRAGYLEAKGAEVAAAWRATPPGVVVDYVNGLTSELPNLDGCSGPHVAFTIDLGVIYVDVDEYPLSACEAPMSTVASLARTLGAMAMVVTTGIALTRYVGGMINAPQMGR